MSINPNNQKMLDSLIKYLDMRVKNNTVVKGKTIRESTSKIYILDMKQYLNFLGDTDLGEVDEFKVNEFFESLKGIKDEEIKARTRNRKIVSLNHLYAYLNSRNFISNNVMDYIEPSEVKTADQLDDDEIIETSVLEKNEIKKFLAILRKEASNPTPSRYISPFIAKINALRNLALFHLMIETGLRIGEVISLELYQITTKLDPSGEEYVNIHVPASKSKSGRKRDVPCSMKVLDEIYEYRNAIPFENETVFLSKTGKPMDTQSTNTILKKYMTQLGIDKNITNHSLRHSYATHNSEILSPWELCSRMGHVDVKITMIYYHVSEESHCKILSF